MLTDETKIHDWYTPSGIDMRSRSGMQLTDQRLQNLHLPLMPLPFTVDMTTTMGNYEPPNKTVGK